MKNSIDREAEWSPMWKSSEIGRLNEMGPTVLGTGTLVFQVVVQFGMD